MSLSRFQKHNKVRHRRGDCHNMKARERYHTGCSTRKVRNGAWGSRAIDVEHLKGSNDAPLYSRINE